MSLGRELDRTGGCLRSRRAAVVVLGDVGRSPRMQYHALALADHGTHVDLIGYSGAEMHPAVRQHPGIGQHLLPVSSYERRRRLRAPLFIADALLRTLGRSVRLLWVLLLRIRRPDFILVQTPPAVPTLLVGLVAARLRSVKLVIDWHNFGYAMLALRLGRQHWAVRMARWCERVLGGRADAHLCVSRAMQAALARWGIEATVLYDRPAIMFAPTLPPMRDEIFARLQGALGLPLLDRGGAGRPAVIVSPTGWTEDEDVAVLLDAAVRCDELIRVHDAAGKPPFPPLLILLTGRGPLRAQYEAAIRRLTLRKVHVRTVWLTPEDYPLVLGAADLGLCLHRSASGVDLPMKLADMFGSGLPVCVLDYGPCLTEQVRHGDNALLFASGAELAGRLYELFKGFPHATSLLDELRRNLTQTKPARWGDGWEADVQPLFSSL